MPELQDLVYVPTGTPTNEDAPTEDRPLLRKVLMDEAKNVVEMDEELTREELSKVGLTPVWIVCIDSVRIPLGTSRSENAAMACLKEVNHPLAGKQAVFQLIPDATLVLLETARALQKRDDRIAALERRIKALESPLTSTSIADRIDDFIGS